MWEIEGTDQFAEWFGGLNVEEQEKVVAAAKELEQGGPALGRPFVDSIKGSRHAHMKELRPRSSHIRILFAFDPRRAAILLIGGDKTNRWKEWYERAIPIADDLYDEYLTELRKEGLL